MQRDALYVADLVESSRTVRGYLDGISRERWDEDQVLRDAVLYRMLLLGEIASALPDFLRDRYPDVAWRHIRAFRNLGDWRLSSSPRSGSVCSSRSEMHYRPRGAILNALGGPTVAI